MYFNKYVVGNAVMRLHARLALLWKNMEISPKWGLSLRVSPLLSAQH